jgi:hypothetical protein
MVIALLILERALAPMPLLLDTADSMMILLLFAVWLVKPAPTPPRRKIPAAMMPRCAVLSGPFRVAEKTKSASTPATTGLATRA